MSNVRISVFVSVSYNYCDLRSSLRRAVSKRTFYVSKRTFGVSKRAFYVSKQTFGVPKRSFSHVTCHVLKIKFTVLFRFSKIYFSGVYTVACSYTLRSSTNSIYTFHQYTFNTNKMFPHSVRKVNSYGRSYVPGKPLSEDFRCFMVDKILKDGGDRIAGYIPRTFVQYSIAICVQACGVRFQNVRFTFQNARLPFQNVRFHTSHVMLCHGRPKTVW